MRNYSCEYNIYSSFISFKHDNMFLTYLTLDATISLSLYLPKYISGIVLLCCKKKKNEPGKRLNRQKNVPWKF